MANKTLLSRFAGSIIWPSRSLPAYVHNRNIFATSSFTIASLYGKQYRAKPDTKEEPSSKASGDTSSTPIGSSQSSRLEELNSQCKYTEVIDSVASGKYPLDDASVKAYLRAVAATGEFEVSQLRSVMTNWLGTVGRTPENPFYVTTSNRGQRFFYIASIGFTILLAFILLSSTLSPSRLFSSSLKQHSPTTTQEKLSDVKGNDEAKEDIQDLLEYLKNPAKFAALGVEMPKGVLLVGPPGTGKTMLARALAGEAGVPFYYTSGSEFEEMLVGVGASRVRSLFKTARQHAPCIIFIDEIDAIGSRRETPGNKTSMTLNQLLVELDGFSRSDGVLVIAATNLPELLDPALIRPGRFDRHVYLDLPSKKTRIEMLDSYLKDKKGPDVDLDVIAKTSAGLSGADIFTIVNRATIEAIKNEQQVVTQKLLEDALESTTMGRRRKSLTITDATKRLTAFHEAGHAIVSLYTPGANVIHKATLVPRGPALGMVRHLSNDDLMHTKQEMLAMMDVAMGGRAAEELIFGKNNVTQGAGSDFQQASSIARNMVTKLGMSEKVGKVFFDERKEHISEDTARLIDAEVRTFAEQSFVRAQDLLTKHSKELHLLANALLEHETLTLDEIMQAVGQKPKSN